MVSSTLARARRISEDEVAVLFQALCDDLDSIGFSRNPSSGDDVGEQQRGEQNTAHLMTNRELVGVVLSGGGPQALGALP